MEELLIKKPIYRLVGDTGVLMEFGDEISAEINQRVRSAAENLRRYPIDGILEVIPSYRSLLVHYDPCAIDHASLMKKLDGLDLICEEATASDSHLVVEIPVAYGGIFGPDLEFVAQYCGLTIDEVISLHSGQLYRIYMMGFTPGFPFLGGLPESLHTPRLESPRPVVPAGSVGIANNQTGVYPVESPGGWRIIGRTPIELFDPLRENPFLFRPGDYIKFRCISEKEYSRFGDYR